MRKTEFLKHAIAILIGVVCFIVAAVWVHKTNTAQKKANNPTENISRVCDGEHLYLYFKNINAIVHDPDCGCMVKYERNPDCSDVKPRKNVDSVKTNEND